MGVKAMKQLDSSTPKERPSPNLKKDFPPNTYQQWKAAAEALLKGAPFEKKLITRTYEGIDLQPIYNHDDAKELPHLKQFPGTGTFLRGKKAAGYDQKPWEISQELTGHTPEEFNQIALSALEGGQSELNIPRLAEDRQILQSLEDMRKAFSGIHLEMISLFLHPGTTSLPMASLLFAYAKEQGLKMDELNGCIGNDPLGELAATGTLPTSLDQSYQEMAALTAYANKKKSNLQTILVQGHPYHESGGNAVQEVAFSIATAVDYVRALQKFGLDIDEIAPRIRFSISVGSNYFTEIAKLRSLRHLWAQIIEAFGGATESAAVHIHSRTANWNKTLFDPYVNVLRGTTEAFSAIVGGCNGLHVSPFDEIIRTPDEHSRRIAKNTQIILQEECDLTGVIDPAGGSWYVEWLTDQIAQKSWKLFQEIEAEGGIAQALNTGIPQKLISEIAQKRDQNISRRKDVFVGTNMYANATEEPLAQNSEIDSVVQKAEIPGKPKDDLTTLLPLLSDPLDNRFVEASIKAVKSGSTTENLRQALHSSKTPAPKITPLKASRGAEKYEKLRLASQAYSKKTGSPPTIFQANIGPSRAYRMRADWTTSFFIAGGFTVLNDKDFKTSEDACNQFLSTDVPVIIITSTDETYAKVVPEMAKKLKAAKKDCILLIAGLPGDNENEWRSSGVDDFVNVTVNNYETLQSLLNRIGVES
jgi:methylmalonyl-CoA mutase